MDFGDGSSTSASSSIDYVMSGVDASCSKGSDMTEFHQPTEQDSVDSSRVLSKLDISLYAGKPDQLKNLSDEEKYNLLTSHFKPNQNFPFHSKAFIEKGKTKVRSFQYSWLQTFPEWLVFSPSCMGVFCAKCVLFACQAAGKGSHQVQGSLVSKPYTGLKHFLSDMRAHQNSRYHLDSMISAESFVSVYEKRTRSIVSAISSAEAEIKKKNREILTPILRAVLFCRRHELPLRGHREESKLCDETNVNEGIFRGVLRLMVESGEQCLKEHFENGAKNAQYISPIIQNDLIDCAASIIVPSIVSDVNSSVAF